MNRRSTTSSPDAEMPRSSTTATSSSTSATRSTRTPATGRAARRPRWPSTATTYRVQRTYTNLTNLLASTTTNASSDDHEVHNDYDGADRRPGSLCGRTSGVPGVHADPRDRIAARPVVRGRPAVPDVQLGQRGRGVRARTSVHAAAATSRPSASATSGRRCPTAIRQTFPFNLFLSPTPPAGCLAAINDPSRTMLGPVQKAKFKNDLAQLDGEAQVRDQRSSRSSSSTRCRTTAGRATPPSGRRS